MSIDQGVMPVITLYQPWASWIMTGWKGIETRTHKGFRSLVGKRILIHAGKHVDLSNAAVHNPFLSKEELDYRPPHYHLTGQILGSAWAYEFRVLDENDSRDALIDCCSVIRYGLFLNEVLQLADPIPVRGGMGIWYYDLDNKKKVLKNDTRTNRT